jgi:D-alanyl-D-alanine dipeptidase
MPVRFERYRDASGRRRWRRYTRINDWLTGNIVPVRSVPIRYRAIYRATLLAAARAARDYGVRLHVNSSYRTRAQQAALYAAYMNGDGNLAARPGTSRHEQGNALDLSLAGVPVGNFPRMRAALASRGLTFNVPSEPWHVEYHH